MTPVSPIVVDSHAHIMSTDLLQRLHNREIRFPNIEVTAHEETYRVAFNGGAPTRPIAPGLTDSVRRAAWLNENGIDLQVVGGWLDVFGYQLPADEGAEWAAVLTEAIQTVTDADPRQLVLGTVPLQDPVRAAEALRVQRAQGMPGVMIATRAGGRELSDPAFTPFWEAADETEAAVFLHPGFSDNPRYEDFGLVNGLARLEDTTVTLARLLYAGVPARFGRAKLIVAHAGAALPYVLGRLMRNHALNPQTTSDPLESFAQLYFDSVVFDHDALKFLIGKVGSDRVLLGSDYPFPIGDLAPRDIVQQADLDEAERVLIDGENARRLFMGDRA